MRRGWSALMVLACVVCFSPAQAAAKTSSGFAAETLMLDMHEAVEDGAAGPVRTAKPLAPGMFHIAYASGTFSIWSPEKWQLPCGNTFERSPMYPSPGIVNGRVGVDAETIFASTRGSVRCDLPTPLHFDRFEISTGSGYSHIEPVGGPRSTPASSHRYRYVLMGAGSKASFRHFDTPNMDNYGRLKIEVREATKDDCADTKWTQFEVFKNRGDCVSYMATRGKNPPARSR